MAMLCENMDATGIADTAIVTGSSTTSPPFGPRSEEATGTAESVTQYAETPERTISPTLAWLVGRHIQTTAVTADGQDWGVMGLLVGAGAAEVGIRANGQANGKYRFQFHTSPTAVGSESSSEFDTGTWYVLRWELNGTTWILYVDGVLEITYSSAGVSDLLPTRSTITNGGSGITPYSSTRRWNSWMLISGSSGADRPGFNPEVGFHTPDGNGNYTAWSNAFGNWDDWVSGGSNDGDGSYCEGANTPGSIIRESSTMSSVTYGQTPIGAKWYGYGKASAAGKAVGNRALFRYGSADAENVVTSQNATSYQVRASVFQTVPDASAWSSFNQANFEGGWRRDDDSAAANVRGTAIAMCIAAIDADPEVATDERRRLLAQVT